MKYPNLSLTCSHHDRPKNTVYEMESLSSEQAPHWSEAFAEPRMLPLQEAQNAAFGRGNMKAEEEIRLFEIILHSRMVLFLQAKDTQVWSLQTKGWYVQPLSLYKGESLIGTPLEPKVVEH